MSNRKVVRNTTIVFALAALVSAGVVWEVGRARAANPPDPDRAFGMVGITRGQTLRLNVVNLVNPPDPDRQIPPDPCRVALSFRDAAGRPFTNSDGQVVRRTVELQAGQSAFIDLNADMYGGPSTNDAVTPARLQLRPFVRVLQEPHDRQVPPDPCRATMEVFDNASGRTSIFAEHAGIDLDRPPPPPCCQPGG